MEEDRRRRVGIKEMKLCNVAVYSAVVWPARAIKGLGEP